MKNHKQLPPNWSTRFLRWFLHEDFYEDIQGDLEEEFHEKIKTTNYKQAARWYNWQILKLFRPSMAKKITLLNTLEKETTMFSNYLKIGFRNIKKYKAGTFINIIGLSTGIAAFILIALFVRDELSYDKHHEHYRDTYRLTVKNFNADGNVSRQWANASSGQAKRIKEDFAQVTHAARLFPWSFLKLQTETQKLPNENICFVDEEVFDIFTFPFIQGDKETALAKPTNIVLTESAAKRVFGSDWREYNLIGKPIQLSRGNEEPATFSVSGVMKDMKDQQHFHYEYLAPIRFLEMIFSEGSTDRIDGNYNWTTYLRLASGTDVQLLEEEINHTFWDKYIGTYSNGRIAAESSAFELQPISDIHLKSNIEGELGANGSLQQVYIFSIIGILILLVACINYLNIATSRYSRRMKEVGLRKVIGAFKSSLIKQFITESMLMILISTPIALILIYLSLPYLNNFTGKQLAFNVFAQLDLLISLAVLIIITSIVTGIYPALFLSKINLTQSLKGEQGINAKKWNFRAVLVGFQYTVTIGLVFAIVVIQNQLRFIQQSDPGFEREHIIRLTIPFGVERKPFKNELVSHPNVKMAAYASRLPTGKLRDHWGARFFTKDSVVSLGFRMPVLSVDPDYLKVHDIELVAGENFRDNMLTVIDMDTIVESHYIINETAAKAMGHNTPNDAIGKPMGYGVTKGHIIGVFKDIHFESIHHPIVPTVLIYHDNYSCISLKVKEENLKNTLDHIETTYAKFDRDGVATYQFLDELFDEQYQKEEQLGSMINVFTIIAAIIGCLGLIGMVGFVIETKLKEIGVRKVLGASSQNIWTIISKRFLLLMSISLVVALPLSFWLMRSWLDTFAYRTNISAVTILLPVVIILLLTLLTISFQIIKATKVNPVECLKNE